MNFLGLNLGDKPEIFSITVIIPILAGIFSFLQVFISMKTNPTYDAGAAQGGCAMKAMMYTMPLISVWITFTLPIGVGVYWITSYLFMTVQVLVLNKIYNPRELREQAMKEMEERRKKKKKKVVKKIVTKDADGNEIDSILQANGSVNVSFKINPLEREFSAITVYAVKYDASGKMLGIYPNKITMPSKNTETEIDVTISNVSAGQKIIAFLFEDYLKPSPLSGGFTLR